jgi:hypothetical protein
MMVGWISLIEREGTLAQVCFPEFGAVRKDVKFDMLQAKARNIFFAGPQKLNLRKILHFSPTFCLLIQKLKKKIKYSRPFLKS